MTKLQDEYLKRAVQLARVADHEALKVAGGLKDLHTRILKRIAIEYPELSAAKVNALNSAVREMLLGYYRDHVEMTLPELSHEIVGKEVIWAYSVMEQVTGQKLVRPILREASKRAMERPYQGHKFQTWFSEAGVSSADRITKQITGDWLSGVGAGEALRNVFGATQRAEADIKTLTRSMFMHLSVEARDVALESYKEHIGGYVWSAILDNRTTPHICGIRDQLRYDDNHQPIGHDLPWGAGPGRIHFNCRSQSIPVVKGEVLPTMQRAAVDAGENYEQGDKWNARGKVTKPLKAKREDGTYEINMVTTRTKYEGWLRRQPTAFVADALGSVEKAKAFKGGESLRAFLPDSGPGSLGRLDNISISNL